MIAVDAYTRFLHGEYVLDYEASTMKRALQMILLRMGKPPKLIILDCQTSFMSASFQEFSINERVIIKKVPPENHLEFIQTLRTMSRSAIWNSNLTA